MQILTIAALWCLPPGLLLCLAETIRARKTARGLIRQTAMLRDEVRMRDAETEHLVTRRLTAVAAGLPCHPDEVPTALHTGLAATRFATNLDTVVNLFSETGSRTRARAEKTAHAAVSTALQPLEDLADGQNALLADLQGRSDDPETLKALLQIAQANAQLMRRIRAIRLLCGTAPHPGRQPVPLTDVVRSARSRIRENNSIRISQQTHTTIVGGAAEPVTAALAELLDNATRHCEAGTSADVAIRPTQSGVAVTIDDTGPGMEEQQRRRTGALLSGHSPATLCRLGHTPKLGLPVVGLLAARYGFRVRVGARSPHGGVRAVLLLPAGLIADTGPGDPTSVSEKTHRPATWAHAAEELARPMGKFVKGPEERQPTDPNRQGDTT
ncbi:signal transduction histidine kinase [Streptomyces sp. TLI_235]|nr:sensor histidine kinase [Streptomyces sp. TLI_235]PBC69595.1 signal transduction histidine kinase [Streptomyces sp. TLI_235]